MEYQNNFSKKALLKRFVISQFFLAAAIVSIISLSAKPTQQVKTSAEHSATKVMATKAVNRNVVK
jgi:hypothetical protein